MPDGRPRPAAVGQPGRVAGLGRWTTSTARRGRSCRTRSRPGSATSGIVVLDARRRPPPRRGLLCFRGRLRPDPAGPRVPRPRRPHPRAARSTAGRSPRGSASSAPSRSATGSRRAPRRPLPAGRRPRASAPRCSQLDLRAGDPALLAKDVAEVADMVTRLKRRIRHEMLGLRSDGDDRRGLVPRAGPPADRRLREPVRGPGAQRAAVRRGGRPRSRSQVGMQLLRVLQEALANAYLHSHATGVVVRFLVPQTKVRLEIEDDGDGFDPDGIPDSRLGVRIMTPADGAGRRQARDRPGGRRVARGSSRRRRSGPCRRVCLRDGGPPVTAAARPTTVLVVDDHRLFREGLAALIERWDDFELVGQRRRRRRRASSWPAASRRISC